MAECTIHGVRTRLSDAGAALVAEIDRRAPDLVTLAQDLVRTRSVNPRYPDADYERELGGETVCTALLEERYAAAGFATERVTVEAGRDNLVARRKGSGGGRSLAFNGHLDTVAAGDRNLWKRSPWSGDVIDGRLHGLGSADMKGPIAAYTIACCTIADLGLPLAGDLVAQCVCGEETGDDAIGTSACLDRGRADVAICAEPTGLSDPAVLSLAPVSVGTLLLSVSVEGRSVHAGRRREAIYPHSGSRSGISAADKGLEIVAALARLERAWGFRFRSSHFDAGQFTINLGRIESHAAGAGSAFFLPDTFRADFAVYYPPERGPEEVRAEIEACIASASAHDEWLSEHPPVVAWTLDMPPAASGDGTAVHTAAVRAARAVTHRAPTVVGFPAGCDATWLHRAGIPTLIYGPGDLADAHRPNESVPIEHLIEAAKVYALTALDLCGVSDPYEQERAAA